MPLLFGRKTKQTKNMDVKIRSKENKESGSVALPSQFAETVRPDLVKRAVLVAQANARQPYGKMPGAGMRASAELSRRRRKYRGGYGLGISRVPRKIMSRSGTRFNWVAANMPGTVGGRAAHAPLARDLSLKINTKERRKAIRSALAATVDASLVSARGHKIPESYPFVLSNEFESFEKTTQFATAFMDLGFNFEMSRSALKTIRAGKGTMRNRKYKRRVGPLVVVSSASKSITAASNLPGFDVVSVTQLNAQLLAPGCHVGRATLFTESALAELAEKKLFM
jgi:large subunit ribosomal protein L4e